MSSLFLHNAPRNISCILNSFDRFVPVFLVTNHYVFDWHCRYWFPVPTLPQQRWSVFHTQFTPVLYMLPYITIILILSFITKKHFVVVCFHSVWLVKSLVYASRYCALLYSWIWMEFTLEIERVGGEKVEGIFFFSV